MQKHPLDVLKVQDPDLVAMVDDNRDLAFEEGMIPVKYKVLMALAIDAAHGAANGVRSLALQAKALGASSEEILEAVRVAAFVAGAGSVYTAAAGLDGVL